MAKYDRSELLQVLSLQGLTRAEALKKIDTIISTEFTLPEDQQNRQLIKAALDLQWFLSTGEHYVSRKEAAKQKLNDLVNAEKIPSSHRISEGKFFRHPVVTMACLLCLILSIPLLFQTGISRQWISGNSVQNDEVYHLNGYEVDLNIVKDAIADISDRDYSITTSDFQVLSSISIVQDIHPQNIPEGWTCQEYSYTQMNNIIYYTEIYQAIDQTDNGAKELSYRCSIFPDASSVTHDIEQTDEGTFMAIGDYSVYLTQNYDMLVATWNKGLINYSLYGPITPDEAYRLIYSIGGYEL